MARMSAKSKLMSEGSVMVSTMPLTISATSLVHDGEGFVEGKVGHEVKQSVVVEHEHGVGAAAQRLQPLEGTGHALTAFNVERGGDDTDDQGTGRLGFLRHDGADTGA